MRMLDDLARTAAVGDGSDDHSGDGSGDGHSGDGHAFEAPPTLAVPA